MSRNLEFFRNDCEHCQHHVFTCAENPTCAGCPVHLEPTVASPYTCACLQEANESLPNCPYLLPIIGE